ncbi:hypothetical protein DFH06DRAFT_1203672 [Mycena polygramma]|nr:hypothetical protein DFH06DRAFT_1203672 [Mycena polygramma]
MPCAKIKDWEINNSFPVDLDPMAGGSETDPEDAQMPVDEPDEPEAKNVIEINPKSMVGPAEDVIEISDSEDEDHTQNKRHDKDSESVTPFAKALELFSFKGLFMQTERYAMARAANPCLEIEDVGPIGLPLSSGIAASIMSDIASDRLEIPAEKVHFQNPHWDAWIQKEAGLACSELAGKSVQPVYRLKSLVLERPGSESNSPKLPSEAVGSLVIFLPSLFSGGQLECRHGLQSKTIDFAPQSQLFTSVLAAYPSVQIACRAITSGYRFSLNYDILQPDAAPRALPPFPDMESAASALKQAMEEWDEDEDGMEPAAFFLQRQYSLKNFSAQSLAGSDAILVAHLAQLAEKLDFQLYIVQLELWQSKYGHYYGYDGPGAKIDRRKIRDLETEDELTGLDVHAVDVQGIPVRISGFDFKGYDTEYLNGKIDDVEPRCDYERLYDEQIRVDEKYDRTLVLLWRTPENSEHPVQIRYSPEYASWALQASVSTSPSTRENILVDSLRTKPQKNPHEKEVERDMEAVTRALCKCACQWSDLNMLLTTLEANQVAANLALIGLDLYIEAFRAFGWNALKDFFAQASRTDVSNPRRQEFAVRLGQAAKEVADAEAEAWSETQQEAVLSSLNRASVCEVDWLLGLGTTHSAQFISEVIYPQLKTQQLESAFWVHFVRRLREHPISAELHRNFSDECVLQAVNNLPAFPVRPAGSASRQVQEPDARAIIEVLKLCENTGNTDLCVRILEKMKQATHEEAFPAECPPWRYYLELTPSLNEYISSVGDVDQDRYDFRPFFEEAALTILGGKRKANLGFFSPCPFTAENLSILVMATKRAGGFSFLDESNKKTLLAGWDSESLEKLVRYFFAEWAPSPDSELNRVLNLIVRQAIDVFDTSSFHAAAAKGNHSSAADEMVSMVKFCFDVGARSELQYLLLHLVSPPVGISISQHVSKVLAPFMPALAGYLTTQNLTLEASPFGKCSASIVKAFASTVMCQTPNELAAGTKVGCDNLKCSDCQKTLSDFFTSDEQTIVLPRPAKAREHLEAQLAAPAPKSWGVKFKVIKTQVGAHKLEISKPANMTIAGLWAENSERGKALLALLGDEAAQRRIMGPNYDEALSQISERRTATKRPMDDSSEMDGVSPVKKAKVSAS